MSQAAPEAGKIAYVMSRFPHLPETFILREMTELEQLGWGIELYPLIIQKQTVVHEEARPWLSRLQATPLFAPSVAAAQAAETVRAPRTMAAVWSRALWENRTHLKFWLRTLAVLPQAAALARTMRRRGIRHVHAHYATHPALVAWIIHQLTGLSYSVTVHAHDIFVRPEMLGTKLRAADFIVAISRFNRDYLTDRLGPWVPAKTHIIHCGIRPEAYPPAAPWSGGPLEIVSVGSLQPYKGHRYLVAACAELRRRGVAFRCRIAGGGELRPELERQIAELGLTESVQLLGPQTQAAIAQFLASGQVYVQPSIITPAGKMEGLPVALMEALACGLPVVATDLSGVPELIRPEETGWLVPPADALALADTLETVSRQPETARRLADAGRRLTLAEFDVRENVRQLAALFARQLAPRSEAG